MIDDKNTKPNISKEKIKKYVVYNRFIKFYQKSFEIIESYIRNNKIITPPILAKEIGCSLETARSHLKKYLIEHNVDIETLHKKKSD